MLYHGFETELETIDLTIPGVLQSRGGSGDHGRIAQTSRDRFIHGHSCDRAITGVAMSGNWRAKGLLMSALKSKRTCELFSSVGHCSAPFSATNFDNLLQTRKLGSQRKRLSTSFDRVLIPDSVSGSSCQCNDRNCRERVLSELPEPMVPSQAPEVVAPMRDAMGLVHRQEGDAATRQHVRPKAAHNMSELT
jgi:hypothetical protein